MIASKDPTQEKQTQTLLEHELRRLSFGVPYAVPDSMLMTNLLLLQEPSGRYPAFPDETALAGNYDVGLSRTPPFHAEQVTAGSLHLSAKRIPWLSRALRLEGTISLEKEGPYFMRQVNRSETRNGHYSTGGARLGNITVRLSPEEDHAMYIDGFLYTVGQDRVFPLLPSPSSVPLETLSLPVEEGKKLLNQYKNEISMTLRLKLPIDVCRLVQDFIGSPPVLIVERGDLLLQFTYQTVLARRHGALDECCAEEEPPHVKTEAESPLCKIM